MNRDDDNPEWTAEDFARARPASEVHGKMPDGLVRKRGRPAIAPEAKKQQVNMRLAPEVLEALRATGPGWQGRAEQILRKGLGLDGRKRSA